MAIFEVPVVPDESDFIMRTAMDGEFFSLRFRFNSVEGIYNLDISDASGEPVILGAACVLGANLLENVASDNKPKGIILVVDNTDQHEEAALATFGTDSRVIYISRD